MFDYKISDVQRARWKLQSLISIKFNVVELMLIFQRLSMA